MLRPIRTLLVTALVCVLPSAARADGYLVPFFGSAFGGTIGEFELPDDSRKPFTWGVCVGSMGGGVFGFETDIAFTPDFFADSDDLFLGGNSVTTAMGSVIIGVPMGGQRGAGFRPYFTAGLGLIRQRVESFGDVVEFSSNNFGYSLGGGAFIFFSAKIGIRGDFRYFRNFQQDEDAFLGLDVETGTLSFTRASLGMVFRF